MVNYKLRDGDSVLGELLYINLPKDFGIGILAEKEHLLLYKYSYYYKVDKNLEVLVCLLPLLEINAEHIKRVIETKDFNFYDILPVEKIVMTAFIGENDYGVSLYWKDLALNWIEDLKLKTPSILELLEKKRKKSYKGLPVHIKVRMNKILLQLLDSAK